MNSLHYVQNSNKTVWEIIMKKLKLDGQMHIRLDSDMMENVKRINKIKGTNVSRLVKDYFEIYIRENRELLFKKKIS